MKIIEKNQLIDIKGGAISAAYITALIRGLTIIIDLGKSLGTALRRIQLGKLC